MHSGLVRVFELSALRTCARADWLCERAYAELPQASQNFARHVIISISPHTMTDVKPDAAPFAASELELHTVHHDGRDIAFSTSPENKSPNMTLFCYPVGAGRRMLLSFQSLFSEIRFLCINRPGKGGTSPSVKGKTHLETVLDDMIVVLDKLQIPRVSILTMCAGTPFAMAFATHFPERTTGRFIGISSWVQPADCGYENTKLLYHIGTKQPTLTGPLTGTCMSGMGSIFSSFPTTWFADLLQKKLSKEEAQAFQQTISEYQ